jgi:hypothetical protein
MKDSLKVFGLTFLCLFLACIALVICGVGPALLMVFVSWWFALLFVITVPLCIAAIVTLYYIFWD